MKILITSSLMVLTLASTLAVATEPSGKESLIFTSMPHPCLNNCKSNDNKATRFDNIDAQYKWINSYKPNGKSVAGVIINGNLTESGEKPDLNNIYRLFKTLEVPYFLGLGGNDYIFNQKDCQVCAVRSIWAFNRHIGNKIFDADGNYVNKDNVYYDFVQSITGHTDALKTAHGAGRLGYTVDLGKSKNIYLIQLNGHVGAENNQFKIEGKDRSFDIAYNTYYINPVVDWLENRLEYAAQYQLNHPSALPKTIVVTMNGDTVDPEIVAVLNKYKVAMRFLGNNGSSANCKQKNDMADDSKFYCLGFSTKRELLELVIDYDKSVFDVIHRTVKPDSSAPIRTAVDLYPTQPRLPTGTFPTQAKVVVFGHYGEYNGVASVRDPATNQLLPGIAATKLTMNTGQVYGVPKNMKKFNVSFLFDALGQSQVEILDSERLNITAPVVCIETSGFAEQSSRSSHQKVVQSTEDKSLNRCFDRWNGYYF